MESTLIAQAEYEISGGGRMVFSLYKPMLESDGRTWGSRIKFGDPLDIEQTIFGENSLQALVLALKAASSYLYGSELFREKKIGIFGEVGGRLVLPATHEFLAIAPYPF